MLRPLLLCSATILILHLSATSGSPITQSPIDDPVATTEYPAELHVQDDDGSGSGPGVTEVSTDEPPTSAPQVIFIRQESEEEDEEESEEEPEVASAPSPASPSPQVPLEEGPGLAGQGEEGAGQGQLNQQQGQVGQQEGSSANAQEEGQGNQAEEGQGVQPDERPVRPIEVGQISQQEAIRPPIRRPFPPAPAPKPVSPVLLEEPAAPETVDNIFPEFGESIIPDPNKRPPAPAAGSVPFVHEGPQPQEQPQQQQGGVVSTAVQPKPDLIPVPPVGEGLSEFEDESGVPASSASTAAPPTSTQKSTTGKYKITKAPSVPVPPPGANFAEEWNNTNTIFMLSPQGRKECECGKIPFKVENADAAGINEYPWTVAVVRSGIFGGGRPHCGGALINDQYVVSAAHCFSGLYADGLQVWLTALNRLDSIDNFVQSDRVLKRDVAEIIMHPNYDSRRFENDIALLKLAHPVDISTSSYYVPACLPAGESTYIGMQARVVGWGSAGSSSSNNRITPNRMCRDDVPIISNEVCNRDTSHKDRITKNHMCAGLLVKQPTDSCLADAGGPLMIPNNGRYTVIGITSHGYTNRRAYSPIVYTRLGNYADWILHNTRDADWCSI